MNDLSTFPITNRWPAKQPELIQVYSYGTPNGLKVPIALEEMGVEFEFHKVTLAESDVKSPEFLSLNPNNKIPAIIDPNGPDGAPIGLFESGAILIYLAEKYNKLLGSNSVQKYKTIQWTMFQMAGQGPMFGQLGFFYKFAGSEIEDPRPLERYVNEAKRILGVMEKQLDGREWINGDYSIADICLAPWLNTLGNYGAKEILDYKKFANVADYEERFKARPAVQKAIARLTS